MNGLQATAAAGAEAAEAGAVHAPRVIDAVVGLMEVAEALAADTDLMSDLAGLLASNDLAKVAIDLQSIGLRLIDLELGRLDG